MIGSFSYQTLRRLPVFFLMDTSSEMIGTLEVTMRQGLLIVKHELSRYSQVEHCIYLSGITFGQTSAVQGLAPLSSFTAPTWRAQGQCNLKPALSQLVEAITYDLIISRPARSGDCTPLVFLVLGTYPVDSWQEECAALNTFSDNRRPLIIVLVTQFALVQQMKVLSQNIFVLDPVQGECMTNFFYWTAHAIMRAYEGCAQNNPAVEFPDLPYGVVKPR